MPGFTQGASLYPAWLLGCSTHLTAEFQHKNEDQQHSIIVAALSCCTVPPVVTGSMMLTSI